MGFFNSLGSKIKWKNGVINLVSKSQFFANVLKKSKAIKAIYVYASESSRFALLKNGIAYYAMA